MAKFDLMDRMLSVPNIGSSTYLFRASFRLTAGLIIEDLISVTDHGNGSRGVSDNYLSVGLDP